MSDLLKSAPYLARLIENAQAVLSLSGDAIPPQAETVEARSTTPSETNRSVNRTTKSPAQPAQSLETNTRADNSPQVKETQQAPHRVANDYNGPEQQTRKKTASSPTSKGGTQETTDSTQPAPKGTQTPKSDGAKPRPVKGHASIDGEPFRPAQTSHKGRQSEPNTSPHVHVKKESPDVKVTHPQIPHTQTVMANIPQDPSSLEPSREHTASQSGLETRTPKSQRSSFETPNVPQIQSRFHKSNYAAYTAPKRHHSVTDIRSPEAPAPHIASPVSLEPQRSRRTAKTKTSPPSGGLYVGRVNIVITAQNKAVPKPPPSKPRPPSLSERAPKTSNAASRKYVKRY